LAYPYGIATARAVVARSFSAAFGTRLDLASSSDDLYKISRIDAYYLRRPETLDRLLSDRAGRWLRTRRTMRSVKSFGAELLGA
jgi:hypothetical protein